MPTSDVERADHVLMLDARNIYRKVSRAIFDFSPEQQKNIAAIIWLYRGQSDRYLDLVTSYLAEAIAHGQATAEPLTGFKEALAKLIDLMAPFAKEARDPDPLAETWTELTAVQATLNDDIAGFAAEVAVRAKAWTEGANGEARDNATLHAAREGLHGMAERSRITLEYNGKIRPKPDRENGFSRASGGGNGTGVEPSPHQDIDFK